MELTLPGSIACTAEAPKPAVTKTQPSTLIKPTKESPTVDDNLNDTPESILEHEGNHRASSGQMLTAGGSKAILVDESQVDIDVRSWLPEPSDISPLSLASSLFEAILNLNGFSALEGQLDEVLSKSSELRQAVLSALCELGNIVKDNLLGVVGVSTQSEGPDESAKSILADLAQLEIARELQRLLENTATILDAPEATADFESLSGDGSTRYDLDEILDNVTIYIDCLMDLSLALESPVIDLEPADRSQ